MTTARTEMVKFRANIDWLREAWFLFELRPCARREKMEKMRDGDVIVSSPSQSRYQSSKFKLSLFLLIPLP